MLYVYRVGPDAMRGLMTDRSVLSGAQCQAEPDAGRRPLYVRYVWYVVFWGTY